MATLTEGQILPTPQTSIVDPSTGVLTQDGYKYLNNLINQLAQATPTATVDNAVDAAGQTQATATQLSAQWNEVTSAALTENGVLLEALQAGQAQIVVNLTAFNVNVYPPPGAGIDALATNFAFVLASDARATFNFFTATQIRSSS